MYSAQQSTRDSGLTQAQRVVAGRIALAHFPAGNPCFDSRRKPLRAAGGRIGPARHRGRRGFPPLETMHRARSGVDLDESLVRLKEAYLPSTHFRRPRRRRGISVRPSSISSSEQTNLQSGVRRTFGAADKRRMRRGKRRSRDSKGTFPDTGRVTSHRTVNSAAVRLGFDFEECGSLLFARKDCRCGNRSAI